LFSPFRITGFIGLLLATTYVCSQSSRFEQEPQARVSASEPKNRKRVIEDLERAVQLNPENVQAHFALGRAYRAEYVDNPQTDDEEAAKANDRLIDRAVAEFKAVVVLAPSNTEALNTLGNIYYRRAKPDEAKLYFRRALKVSPSDKEALYTLAFLDWQYSYRSRMMKIADLHLKRAALIRNRSCSEVRSKNLEQVEEGITALKKLSRISDFPEARYLLSLLYRERADIQCGDSFAYNADLRSAKEWEQAFCSGRTRKAEHTPYPWPPAPPPPPNLGCLISLGKRPSESE
jgi:tetratricopeptide (TPR) repeat protein